MKHLKLFENYNSKQPMVKKGDKVKVKMNYFEGAPEYDVEAKDDSFYNEETGEEQTFSVCLKIKAENKL